MKKRSYKVLWNVFLFVICGGSLIYGFVQQRRVVEAKVQMGECQQRVDSLKREIEKLNDQVKISSSQLQSSLQLQVERNVALDNGNRKH